MIIIDAENQILGRFATFAAKQAMLGREVRIINAEKAVISGKPSDVIARVKQNSERGNPVKGPFVPKMADRYVRRVIRGMLPHRQPKGAEALKRVLCYTGIPEELAKEKPTVIKGAAASKLPTLNYTTVAEIVRRI